jgi:RNA polymerase sigma factor FliA
MRDRLTTAIEDLPERERLVMTLYYYEETNMKEIGLILGVVESRVSQIHASAVLHLRARLAMSTTLKEPQNKPGGHSERGPSLCKPKAAKGLNISYRARTKSALNPIS